MRAVEFASGEQLARLNALKKRRLLRRWLIPIGLVAASLLAFVLLKTIRPTPEKKVSSVRALLVSTVPVRIERVQINVASQGTVRPRTETSVVAEVAGKIVKIAPQFLQTADRNRAAPRTLFPRWEDVYSCLAREYEFLELATSKKSRNLSGDSKRPCGMESAGTPLALQPGARPGREP